MGMHYKKVKHDNQPGEAHYLTFSCRHRLPLLSRDRTRYWLLQSVGEARRKHGFDLWAWVIMPEHVHLLIYPQRRIYAMDHILQSIKQPVGARAIEYLRNHAPWFLDQLAAGRGDAIRYHFWQPGPGHDRNIYDIKTLYHVIDYIHMNPVRRGLVAKPIDWLWSSARDWAGLDGAWLKVDRTLPMIYPDGQ